MEQAWESFETWDAWVAIGTLSVAVATLLLATATLVTARLTRKLARASEEEVKAVLAQAEAVAAQAEAARAQVEVASDAVAARVRPVFISVPKETEYVQGVGAHLEDYEKVEFVDRVMEIAVSDVHVQTTDDHTYVTAPVRNAGEGIAFVEGVWFTWTEGVRMAGLPSSGNVPPGERTRLRFSLDRSLEGTPTLDQLRSYGTFSVEVCYGDLAGGRWFTRLDVHREETSDRWLVRQTHVGAQGEEPGVSSGPAT